jgi:8-oxo-dGTP pyrophosphatase MutT (NUDIX family)
MASLVRRETSAGGVVVSRRQGRDEVCLILREYNGRRAWCLPKGHVERGEETQATAVREVREETGVVADILQPLGAISYTFTPPGAPSRCAKMVHFFLMRAGGAEPSAPYDATEVLEVRWMPIEEALRRLAYASERQLLRKAQQVLG